MATILVQPDALSLSANINKFVVTSSADVAFQLYCGSTLLIDELYSPGTTGRIEIDIKEIVRNELSFNMPDSDIFQQSSILKSFTAYVNSNPVTFNVIRGGVHDLAETPLNFLTANFLTWQPQTKKTSYYQPEWLTYYSSSIGNVKVKFHLKDGTQFTHSLYSIQEGTCWTFNMQFSYVMSLYPGEKYGYYDVWVENTSGTRLTYIQRYIYSEPETQDEFFLFENSLGGIDTAVMSGESTFAPDISFISGLYDQENTQLDGNATRLYTKNTGYKSETEAAWLWDFLASLFRYKIVDGAVTKITLTGSDIGQSSLESMKSYTFTYRLSVDEGLLKIARITDNLPANLEITTPEGLFFLAPRLVDFSSAVPDDTLLFAVQSPFSQVWRKFSWGSIWNFIYNRILESAIGLMAHVHDNHSIISRLTAPAGKLQYEGQDVGVVMATGVNLGETNTTAYRGDRGKIAYEHSQKTDIHFTDAPVTGKPYARNNREWVQIQQPGGTAVRLSTNQQVFEYDADGAFMDSLSFAWIYTTLFNMSAENIYYEWLKNDLTIQNTTASTLWYTPPATYGSPDVIEVRVRTGSVNADILARDSITMYGIRPGADGRDAYTIVLSNPVHSFPADKDGVVTDYSGSGTDIRVWKGIIPVPYGTGTNTFSVTATGTNVSVGSSSIVSVYTRRYANSSNMVAVTARIDFTIKARDSENNELVFIQTLTYTISKEGQPGNNGTPGPAGPSLVFQGDYNPSAIYTGSSNRIDAVKYTNGKYYSALRTAGTFSGKAPIDSLYWQIADGQFRFVATELLFAESTYVKNLIAEQLKTAETGRRIEINAGDKQQIAIYDQLNALKVLVKPEPISSRAMIEAGATRTTQYSMADCTLKTTQWDYPDTGTVFYLQTSDSFEVGMSGVLELEVGTININAYVTNSSDTMVASEIGIVLEKFISGSWVAIDTIGFTNNNDGSKLVTKTARGLSAGTFRLAAYHTHTSWNEPNGSQSDHCTASSFWKYYGASSSFVVTARSVVAQTEIGTDGLTSVWASNIYFHFSQNGLFVKMGNKSLEITADSFKINGIEH